MKLHVSKYHGCGNDFILIAPKEVEGWSEPEIAQLAESVCDRHTGIGADGLIVARTDPFFMEYYNADGSRADMCGNGIRCLSAFYLDHHDTDQDVFDIETLAGTKTITVKSRDPYLCQVMMGQPDFDPKKIQAALDTPIWKQKIETSLGPVEICSFYMGTIHTVVFVPDPFDEKWEALGKELCHHPLFQNQTNVNFVEVLDDHHLKAATYERGCGMTLACGTGMCASAVTAYKQNKTGSKVNVLMKKGFLDIEITDQGVLMTGPARKIMEGEYIYEKSSA